MLMVYRIREGTKHRDIKPLDVRATQRDYPPHRKQRSAARKEPAGRKQMFYHLEACDYVYFLAKKIDFLNGPLTYFDAPAAANASTNFDRIRSLIRTASGRKMSFPPSMRRRNPPRISRFRPRRATPTGSSRKVGINVLVQRKVRLQPFPQTVIFGRRPAASKTYGGRQHGYSILITYNAN